MAKKTKEEMKAVEDQAVQETQEFENSSVEQKYNKEREWLKENADKRIELLDKPEEELKDLVTTRNIIQYRENLARNNALDIYLEMPKNAEFKATLEQVAEQKGLTEYETLKYKRNQMQQALRNQGTYINSRINFNVSADDIAEYRNRESQTGENAGKKVHLEWLENLSPENLQLAAAGELMRRAEISKRAQKSREEFLDANPADAKDIKSKSIPELRAEVTKKTIIGSRKLAARFDAVKQVVENNPDLQNKKEGFEKKHEGEKSATTAALSDMEAFLRNSDFRNEFNKSAQRADTKVTDEDIAEFIKENPKHEEWVNNLDRDQLENNVIDNRKREARNILQNNYLKRIMGELSKDPKAKQELDNIMDSYKDMIQPFRAIQQSKAVRTSAMQHGVK